MVERDEISASAPGRWDVRLLMRGLQAVWGTTDER